MQYKKYKNEAGMNLRPTPSPSQNSHAVRWHCTAESERRVVATVVQKWTKFRPRKRVARVCLLVISVQDATTRGLYICVCVCVGMSSPKFQQLLSSVVAGVGQDALFQCQIDAQPAPVVTWSVVY